MKALQPRSMLSVERMEPTGTDLFEMLERRRRYFRNVTVAIGAMVLFTVIPCAVFSVLLLSDTLGLRESSMLILIALSIAGNCVPTAIACRLEVLNIDARSARRAVFVAKSTQPIEMAVVAASSTGSTYRSRVIDGYRLVLSNKVSKEVIQVKLIETNSLKRLLSHVPLSTDWEPKQIAEKLVKVFLDPQTSEPVAILWDANYVWIERVER